MKRIVLGLEILLGAIGAAVFGCAVFIAADADGSPEAYRIPSGAMAPTLLIGDYLTAAPHQHRDSVVPGDLVVHQWPEDTTKHFVKRVVGTPDDTIAMVGGVLQRNGSVVRESYAHHTDPDVDPVTEDFTWQRRYLADTSATARRSYRPSRNNWGPIVIPRGRYFVLGDNRDNSLDSRYWGFLSAAQIIGVPKRIYFSRDPETGAIRWGRIGRRVR